VNTRTLGEIGGKLKNRSDKMQNHGMKFIITGIFIIVLSGLEKILIFLAFQGRITDNVSLKNLTPEMVWNVPKSTYTLGILILILGILLIVLNSKFLKKQIELIKKNSAEFNNKYQLGTLKNNEKNDE
jgi:hypothetical protein